MPDKKQFTREDCEIIKREVLYQGIFKLSRLTLRHRLFEGGWVQLDRELFERSPAVGILPHDPILDRVILIEQFRPGALSNHDSPWIIEIPAGIIEPNEKPEEVAHREMMEEAGCTLLELKPIFNYFVSPGGSNEYFHLYYGRIDASNIEGIHGLKDEHEDIRVLNLSTQEAFELMQQGKIKNSPALLALMWLQMQKN